VPQLVRVPVAKLGRVVQLGEGARESSRGQAVPRSRRGRPIRRSRSLGSGGTGAPCSPSPRDRQAVSGRGVAAAERPRAKCKDFPVARPTGHLNDW
jgi:hypothetical protein